MKINSSFISILLPSLLVGLSQIVMSTAFASGNNELKDFRFRTCDRSFCVAVESAKGWLSHATGAFVASGEKGRVKLQIIRDGKITREFAGDEAVSQPEVHSITIESERSVVLVDINTGEYETFAKSANIRNGGSR